MTPLRLVLNLLWLVCGGLLMALGWLLAAVLMVVTIIGIPWARAAWTIGVFALWPFGREAVDREELTGRGDLGTGPLGTVGNLVWLLLAGLWLGLGHAMAAIGLALTIIGLPFAWQHLKLAAVSLWPIGKTIVPVEIAAWARRRVDFGRFDPSYR